MPFQTSRFGSLVWIPVVEHFAETQRLTGGPFDTIDKAAQYVAKVEDLYGNVARKLHGQPPPAPTPDFVALRSQDHGADVRPVVGTTWNAKGDPIGVAIFGAPVFPSFPVVAILAGGIVLDVEADGTFTQRAA